MQVGLTRSERECENIQYSVIESRESIPGCKSKGSNTSGYLQEEKRLVSGPTDVQIKSDWTALLSQRMIL